MVLGAVPTVSALKENKWCDLEWNRDAAHGLPFMFASLIWRPNSTSDEAMTTFNPFTVASWKGRAVNVISLAIDVLTAIPRVISQICYIATKAFSFIGACFECQGELAWKEFKFAANGVCGLIALPFALISRTLMHLAGILHPAAALRYNKGVSSSAVDNENHYYAYFGRWIAGFDPKGFGYEQV